MKLPAPAPTATFTACPASVPLSVPEPSAPPVQVRSKASVVFWVRWIVAEPFPPVPATRALPRKGSPALVGGECKTKG